MTNSLAVTNYKFFSRVSVTDYTAEMQGHQSGGFSTSRKETIIHTPPNHFLLPSYITQFMALTNYPASVLRVH